MKCCTSLQSIFTAVVAFLLAGAFVLSVSDRPSAADKKERLLRHAVMFEFKESSSKEEVQTVVDAFRALPTKIPQIEDFEYGTNNSPEKLNDGFTHLFLVSFKSEEDRGVYLPHEAHKAFVEVLKPHMEKVMVVDYWAEQ